MGDSPKRVKSKKRRKKKEERRKRERSKVGDNNGQATHGARKHPWRTQDAWAKILKSIFQMFKIEKSANSKIYIANNPLSVYHSHIT